MGLTIERLSAGSLTVDAGDYVQYRMLGTKMTAPVYAYLILGAAEGPILVDTGSDASALTSELSRIGLNPADIRYVIQTHLHSDHAGGAKHFPATTVFALDRRELEVAASGMMRQDYRFEDLELFIDRLHTPGALWTFDFLGHERQPILPGISVARAGGHTEGSINVFVETAEGTACICGDVVQDVKMQVIAPPFQMQHREPRLSGNSGMSQIEDRRAIKSLLASADWLLPAHDDTYRIRHGVATGRTTLAKTPGPIETIQ